MIRREAHRLGEDFLNSYLTGSLTSQQAERLRKETAAKVALRLPVRGVSAEISQTYLDLELIREFTTHSVELAYPQCLADPIFVRAYSPSTVRQAGVAMGKDVGVLVGLLERTAAALELPQESITRFALQSYLRRSRSLLLPYQAITATKVYFLGPLFYEQAGGGWSITASTGSGLPDPLEWHGSAWFAERYGAPPKAMAALGVGSKNPFRELNFSLGICNPGWKARRLYIWERDKTARQFRIAHALAASQGKEGLFLHDAVNQLFLVFRTRNLMILEVGAFPPPLKVWTRASSANLMLSCREGTPEGKISHGIWLQPGMRLSAAAVAAIVAGVGQIAAAALEGGEYAPALQAMVLASLAYWQAQAAEGQWAQLADIRRRFDREFRHFWRLRDAPGVVKQGREYSAREALAKACETVAELLTTEPAEVEASFRRIAAVQAAHARRPLDV